MANIIEEADTNGDGKISYAEFILCMTGEVDTTNSHPNGKESNKARRLSYDSNNSGEGATQSRGMLSYGDRASSMSQLLNSFQSMLSVNRSAQVGPSGPTYPRSHSSSRVHELV